MGIPLHWTPTQNPTLRSREAGCPVLGSAILDRPVGRQWRLLLELLRIFTPALERGWEVDLTLTGDGVGLQGIAGNGGERINADEVFVPEQFATDAEYQLAVARAMAARAGELGGKAKE